MAWKPRTFLALLLASMGCWLERQAATQIEYLKAENRLLRARLGRRRLVFTDPERRTLAALAKEIGSRVLRDLDPLVSPATLLRWHRDLVAQKWTFLERRTPGRPRTKVNIEQLVVRMASENPSWGYTRIHGALRNLDIKIGRGTIRRILKDHLIEPAPVRGRCVPWLVFLKAHWKAIAASDLNAFAERFVRSVKSECLSKLIPIGVPMLRRAVHEYMEHYHCERMELPRFGGQFIVLVS
jgi:putative transposase